METGRYGDEIDENGVNITLFDSLIRNCDEYNDVKTVSPPTPFREFFDGEDYDIVQLFSVEQVGDDGIVGFFGQCEWRDGEFNSLDGDTYDEDILVYGYEVISTGEDYSQCINVYVKG